MTRARRGPDPYLDWKIRIFFAGALLAGAGVLLGHDVLVLLASLVLLTGLLATTVLAKRRERPADEGAGDETDEPEPSV